MSGGTTTFPKVPFLATLASLVNVAPGYCLWAGDPEPKFLPPASPYIRANMVVDIAKRVGVGWDDMRQTDNPDGTYSLLQVGRRVLTVSVNLFYWGSPTVASADDILEDLNSSIFDDLNRDVLNEMGLALENTGNITPLPTFLGARYISAAHTDMTIAFAVTRQASPVGSAVSIREVIGQGTNTTESGGTTIAGIDVVGS